MYRNKVHHVYTVERVAKHLGNDECLIHELILDLEPEGGVIWVYAIWDQPYVVSWEGGGRTLASACTIPAWADGVAGRRSNRPR